MSRKASWSTSPERWQTSYWSWPATVSISNNASQSTISAVLRTSTFAFSTGVTCFHYSSCSGVPVEAAVVELMEVKLEEVFNEEGNITSISGVLSSPLVSTSVPASTSKFTFEEGKPVFAIDIRGLAVFLVDQTSIIGGKVSPDRAMAAL